MYLPVPVKNEHGRRGPRSERQANVAVVGECSSCPVLFVAFHEFYSSLHGSVANFSGFHPVQHWSNAWRSGEADRQVRTVIDFKGVHYPKAVILHAVFFYVRYAVSYRDLEEILAERGVAVDHATLNRWVVKYSPLIAATAQARKRATAKSWRMDETYIKVRGQWTYLYRAVDRDGQTLDFMLSEHRDTAAARRFFKRAISTNGVPDRVVIDKSGANLAGLQAVNVILKFTGTGALIKILQVKYLNNNLEQDHRFIKRITAPMLGFKAFHSAAATVAGIEAAHMIRKGQFGTSDLSAFQQFAALAA
jgi:putative transposase